MKKYLIGLIAAALGASSALAASPGTLSNYDVARSAPIRAANLGTQKTAVAAKRMLRNGSVSVAGSALPSLGGYPSNFDARMKSPTFLWADAAQKPVAIGPVKGAKFAESSARAHLATQAASLGLSKQTIADAKLVTMNDSGKGPVIARFVQMKDGLEVFGHGLNVMMGRDMKLVATSGYFASAEVSSGKPTSSIADKFSMAPERALSLAYADAIKQTLPSGAFAVKRTAGEYTNYAARVTTGEIRPVGEQRVRKMVYALDGRYLPVYYVEVEARSVDELDQYMYGYVISAQDGRVLFRKSLIDDAVNTYRVYADPAGINQPLDSPLGNALDPTAATAANPFITRVPAANNLVTLDHGPISTNDPWLPAGATVTTGNNVDAYVDIAAPDGFTAGDFRAAVTAASIFDYPYTPDADPSTASQRNYAIVNQFYIDNWLHDWWYGNGFNEAAGNAQDDNFGRGGVGGDHLLAEGQDNSGRNNANEATPADGGSPRQQMYLFDGAVNGEVTINTPPGIGTLAFNTAGFGPQLFDVTGNVVASAPQNGCTAFTNGAAVTGNIALIDRGACSFQTKTVNAQNAGATAVILANNGAGPAPGLAGDPTQPPATIGTLSVSQADGAIIRAALTPGPVNARVRRAASTDIDGTVDIQIIAHEWFHTTSNRLVGNASGLSSQQGGGMGEGWSDFDSMMASAVRSEDKLVAGNETYQGAYPLAYYATRDNYFGIRRAPYSTSFAIFPLTFQHISDGVPLPVTAPLAFGQNGANNSEVHNVGEIWCNTLWEFYASLLNDPRYSFTQAQERMKTYVIQGLMMTPNAPTLLEARDGILAAARATDAADFNLAATAFAKRGMGVGAIAPDRNDITNSNAIEDFTVTAGHFTVTDASLDFGYFNGAVGFLDNDGILDPGETALLSITIVSNGTQDITAPVIANLTSTGDITFGNGGQITFPASAAAPLAYGVPVTGTITARLNSATQAAQPVTISIAYPDVGATPTTVFESPGQSIDLLVNADVVPNQRASDDIEQVLAAVRDWSTLLTGTGGNWQVIDGDQPGLGFGTGLVWYVPDNGGPSDVTLATPPLVVGSTAPFSIAFDHYFQFEFAGVSGGVNVGFDGGVIEISNDNGATWTDVVTAGGTFTTGNGYNGVILGLGTDGIPTPDDTGGAPGFVDNNFATNGGLLESVVLDFGNAYAGQTVRLRFREVSDAGAGEFGWVVDNVAFTGITNLPFSNTVADDGVAENQAPVANAGPDQTVKARDTVTLDGRGSTDDVGVTSYAWTQVSGPAVTLTGASTAQPTFRPSTNGTVVLQLTVMDVRAASSTDTVAVNVQQRGGGSFGLLILLPGLLAVALRRRMRRYRTA